MASWTDCGTTTVFGTLALEQVFITINPTCTIFILPTTFCYGTSPVGTFIHPTTLGYGTSPSTTLIGGWFTKTQALIGAPSVVLETFQHGTGTRSYSEFVKALFEPAHCTVSLCNSAPHYFKHLLLSRF